MLKKFAEELVEARKKAGVTLPQIAAKTRIDMKFLDAIERGDFAFLPELYVKAFLKQYAKVIGLDEEEVVEKYEAAKSGKQVELNEDTTGKGEEKQEEEERKEAYTKPSAKVAFEDEEKKKPVGRQQSKNQNLIIGGAIAGVLAVFALVYFLFINTGSEIIVEEKPYEDVLKETPLRYVEDEEKQNEETTPQIINEELELTITNTDSTDSAWVLVIYDDSRQEDFMLFPHTSKSVKANSSFKITLGNSGVVSLRLNGSKLAFEGRRGAVRYFKIDNNGIERLHSPPKLNRE